MARSSSAVSLIPLGGVGEIGKNMWVVEQGDEILVLDCGVMFPDEEMLGVDLVIPDIAYLKERRDRVKAILLSHGHEDHIGALPYVLRQLNVPVYGTRLTLGLVEAKLEEHGLAGDVRLHEVKAGDVIRLGSFTVEFIHVNHSLADVVAMAITTRAGVILYATDFKFDHTPIDGKVTDIHRLAELGRSGLLCLMSDSTNAERPGYTLSERTVGDTLIEVFREAEGRIVVAAFASHIHRIQQILDAAQRFGRKVCVVGRSMVKNVDIAARLGYLHVPDGIMIDTDQLDKYPPDEVVVITTGSQGEPMAALTRMAMNEHKQVAIERGDTVIISATPIPGNEKSIGKTINHLFKLGARVIYHAVSGVHVSGHASQEELKWMLNLTRPKFFIPIHGEYRMLATHGELARQVGIPAENIVLPEIGDRIELTPNGIRKGTPVESGRVLVDGLGVGDVGNIVLRDRQQLSQDGILIVVVSLNKQTGEVLAGPDIISRGFVYMRESEGLIEEAREMVKNALAPLASQGITEWGTIKSEVRDVLQRYLYEKTKRRPVILPIIMEV
ncbi:MAG: ribonuclease J [Firmicutes bacterium]|nr:ribonuclease J [Bacillota bacterium]MBO2520721.1 ribonuclease J [Bacillota bacterium]